jgi:hypothetical protein
MNTQPDSAVTSDIQNSLRTIIDGIVDRIANPIVRESVITAADVSLLRQRPASADMPENVRRQTIGGILDGLIERMQQSGLNSSEAA